MEKLDYEKKLAELKRKQANTNLIYLGSGLVGGIGGLTYAVVKQKSFWGKVGFFILGSLVVGVPVRMAMIARTNKLNEKRENLENEYNESKNKK